MEIIGGEEITNSVRASRLHVKWGLCMLRWRWGCVQGFEDLRVTVTLKDNACDVAEMSVLSATVTLAEKNEV